MNDTTKFNLGNIVATADVLDLYGASQIDLGLLFDRHQSGDWGDVTRSMEHKNNQAISTKDSVTSTYAFTDFTIQIITGHDHRCTTVSLYTIET